MVCENAGKLWHCKNCLLCQAKLLQRSCKSIISGCKDCEGPWTLHCGHQLCFCKCCCQGCETSSSDSCVHNIFERGRNNHAIRACAWASDGTMESGVCCTIASQLLVENAETKKVSIHWVRGRLIVEGEELAICIASTKSLALLCT